MEKKGLIIFSVNNRHYGIRADYLYRIIEGTLSITYLPGAAEYIEGIICFEGDILPVISISKFFGIDDQRIKQSKVNKQIIIMQKENTRLGLLLEEKIEFITEPQDVTALEIIDIERFLREL